MQLVILPNKRYIWPKKASCSPSKDKKIINDGSEEHSFWAHCHSLLLGALKGPQGEGRTNHELSNKESANRHPLFYISKICPSSRTLHPLPSGVMPRCEGITPCNEWGMKVWPGLPTHTAENLWNIVSHRRSGLNSRKLWNITFLPQEWEGLAA